MKPAMTRATPGGEHSLRPETCLQLNMVYQEWSGEKLAEVSLLLAQNREQQVRQALAQEAPPQLGDQALGPILQRTPAAG